jgi:hypothetical protein
VYVVGSVIVFRKWLLYIYVLISHQTLESGGSVKRGITPMEKPLSGLVTFNHDHSTANEDDTYRTSTLDSSYL